MIHNKLRRVAVATASAALAAAAAISLAAPASAASTLELDYLTTGSTTLTNPNSNVTVDFAPAVLQSFLKFDGLTGNIKALLPFKPTKASFLAYGFLPAKGTVVFTQVGYANGSVDLSTTTGLFPLTVTAQYVVTLRDVSIGGTKVDVGTNCQTVKPVTATVTSDDFNLDTATLNGSYTLSQFVNCGKALQIINNTLPGPGNLLQLVIKSQSSASQRAIVAKALTPQG